MYPSFKLQIGTALLLASLASFTHASDDAARPLKLTAFTDAPGGAKVLDGQYEAAIAEIRQSKNTSAIDSLPLTNLCVAQIGAGELADARTTCDAAIDAARRDRKRAPSRNGATPDRYKHFVNIANANRAVLSRLSGSVTVVAERR